MELPQSIRIVDKVETISVDLQGPRSICHETNSVSVGNDEVY